MEIRSGTALARRAGVPSLPSFDTITAALGVVAGVAAVVAIASAEVLRRRRANAQLIASLRQRLAENERLLQLLPESLKQVVNIRMPESEIPNAAVRQVNVAVRSVKTLLDPEVVAVFFHDRPSGGLRLSGGFGIPAELRPDGRQGGLVVPLPEGKAGLADQLRALKGVAGLKIDLAAPILSQDELLGVVAIGGGRQSTAYQKWLLALVAELTAVAILAARGRQQLRHESTTDPLTGLYNRKYLMERSAIELGRAEAYGSPLSVILFDIDHFKHYNDRNGHPTGDACLKAVARIFSEITRGSDFVARYGGEEFILVSADADAKRALEHAERIRAAVEKLELPGVKAQPGGSLSISAGVAAYPAHGESMEELVEAADAALYKSKQKGRNRVTAASGRSARETVGAGGRSSRRR